jgi:hypothetical protein
MIILTMVALMVIVVAWLMMVVVIGVGQQHLRRL